MDSFASFNFEIVDIRESRLSAIGSASLYGKGVFTTAAVIENQVFLWDRHWRRLSENAARLDISLDGIEKETVGAEMVRLLLHNERSDGRVRVTFFDDSSGGAWSSGSATGRTSVLAVTADRHPPRSDLRVTISPFLCNSSSPLSGLKTCNYLEPLLAVAEAKKRGCDEAIRLNERGEVVSACMANVFWLKGDRIYTPGLKTGCLPGTTREHILENFECEEVRADLDELKTAEAIYLTSAGLGIASATWFDDSKLQPVTHPIANFLHF